jgi:hypothetical protein
VLFWIDSLFGDCSARIVRAFALAEALKTLGAPHVTIACPDTDGIFLDSNLYRIPVVDNTKTNSFKDLEALLRNNQPDCLIADVVAVAKLRAGFKNSKRPYLVLLADTFSESHCFADLVLIPGLLPPPNFEEIDLLPSHLSKILHGLAYIPFPTLYQQPPAVSTEPQPIGLVLSGTGLHTDLVHLVQHIESVHPGPIELFVDGSPKLIWSIKNTLSTPLLSGVECTIRQRMAWIDHCQMIVAFPSIHVYECLARHKPVLLLPRSDVETKIAALLQTQNLVRAFPGPVEDDLAGFQATFQAATSRPHTAPPLRIPLDGAARIAQELQKRISAAI